MLGCGSHQLGCAIQIQRARTDKEEISEKNGFNYLPVDKVPYPPKSTLVRDRFMALHMM